MVFCQFKVSHQRNGRDIRTCKYFNSGEVVFFWFQVKISKRTGWLQPALDVAGRLADEYVWFSREFFDQSRLLERFSCVKSKIRHGGFIVGEQNSLTVASVGHMDGVLQYDGCQCTRSYCQIRFVVQVSLENGIKTVFHFFVCFFQAFLDKFLCGQTQFQIVGQSFIDASIKIFGCIFCLYVNRSTTKFPPCPSKTLAVNPLIDFSLE